MRLRPRAIWRVLNLAVVGLLLMLWAASYCRSVRVATSIGEYRLAAGSDLGMLGFEWDVSANNRGQPWTWNIGSAGATRDGEGWWSSLFDWTVDGEYVGVPHWGALAIVLAAWLPTLIRHYRCNSRASRGLCAECGYDLRGTPDRCPECGAVRAARLVAA